MKKNNLMVVISCVFAAFILTLVIAASGIFTKKLNVAFCGLTKTERSAIETKITEINLNKKNKPKYKINFTSLDENKNLASQNLKKTDLLFCYDGLLLDDFLKGLPEKKLNSFAIENSFAEETTSSMKEKIVFSKNKKIASFPLGSSNTELLIDTRMISNLKSLNKIDELENFISSCKKNNSSKCSLLFAGADDEEFLNFLSLVCESVCSVKNYNKIQQALSSCTEKNFLEEINLICQDAELLEPVINLVSSWIKKSIVSSTAFNVSIKDLNYYMEIKNAPLVVTSLKNHREFDFTVLKNYITLPKFSSQEMAYFPSEKPLETRRVVAKSLCAINLSSKKYAKKTFEYFCSKESQEDTVRKIGLAPSNRNARTLDSTADDLRFWIAATNVPLSPFEIKDKNLQKEICKELRSIILR